MRQDSDGEISCVTAGGHDAVDTRRMLQLLVPSRSTLMKPISAPS